MRRMNTIRVYHEPDQGAGDRLVLNSAKFAEVMPDGEVTVYGKFSSDEVAAMIRAAYLLAKEMPL